MLLQLHGVPISSTSQQSRSSGDVEARNVVGRGLRWPAAQRGLQVLQSSKADACPQQAQLPQRVPMQEPCGQPRSAVTEETAFRAACRQTCSASQLSTATDVDMREADVVAEGGTTSMRKYPVDVSSMVAATTALLAEVCPDRSPSELEASAARYVRLLIESTSGERLAQPAAARLLTIPNRGMSSCSAIERTQQPQQFHIHFGSQVPHKCMLSCCQIIFAFG